MAQRRKIGLARALSKLGYCSRSEASELVRAGRVMLNQRVRRDPECPVDLPSAHIQVDSHAIRAQARIYLALNKPRGVITTASDDKNRRTVYQCLDQNLPWLAPVGRLDKASEGLLLMTNDPEWSARILDPATHLEKTYHVQVGIVAQPELIAGMTQGVQSAGRELLRVKCARILRQGGRNSWLEIVLDEGKNRHIRRLLDQLGIEVLRLVRVAIGPLSLGDLVKGSYRPLLPSEKQALDRAIMRHF